MIRFFTLVYGTKKISISMTSLECTMAKAQAQVDQVMQAQGLDLNWIHLLESVNGEFVEVETE